jgi:excisionase family DNA binding protein
VTIKNKTVKLTPDVCLVATTPEIITPGECAALLRVNESWIYEKCRTRQRNPLPAHRIGRYLRFRRSEVLAWFDRTSEPAPKKRGRR